MKKYIIYYIEDNMKNIVEKIESDNDNFAIEQVDKIRSENRYPGKEIYWDYYYNEARLTEDMSKIFDEVNLFGRIIDFITHPMYKIYWFVVDSFYSIKYAYQRIVRGYDDRDSYNVFDSMLKHLKGTLDKMVENLYGYPDKYRLLAIESHGDTKGVDEIAFKMWKDDLNELLFNISLFWYYDNCGYQDSNDNIVISTVEYPIPRLKNSLIVDYTKLYDMKKTVLDKIFDFMKENGYFLYE